MKKIVILFIAFGFISCSESKDGFVQVSKLYNEFEMTKELTKKIESNTLVKSQILDSLKFNIKQIELKLNAKQTEELLGEYELKKREFIYKDKVFKEESQRLMQQYNAQSLQQINTYVEEYGKANGYDYIYGASGNGSLMYANDSKDLTDQVLIYVNKKYQGK